MINVGKYTIPMDARGIWDEILPSYMGVILRRYHDPVMNQSVKWNVIRFISPRHPVIFSADDSCPITSETQSI